MSSTKSLLSVSDSTGHEDIERMGYLKKMKTMKKKFFVLRREDSKSPARLEYYDTEKKFKLGQPPKRSIILKKCFNINKRVDMKSKHCLALYTKDDCFCVVLDTAEDASDWLKSLLELQHGGATEPGEIPKPAFDIVWQVKVQEKGLGSSYGIQGPYRVCLTSKSLSLVKMGCKDEAEEERNTYEFSLTSIRRCGSSQCFFYMEVGRSSVTGAGELWMFTEDQHIATHMHNAIITAMSGSSKSATGATPPSATVEPEEIGPKPRNRSCSYNEASKPVGIQRRATHANDSALSSGYISATVGPVATAPSNEGVGPASLYSSHTLASSVSTEHSIGVVGSGSRERCDSLPCAPRTRTTSEGLALPATSAPHHPRVLAHHPVHHNFLSPAARPHSMYARGVSYSPPIDCSPVSPVSGGCSTDSAGSSLSIDETDGSINWLENLHQHQITRSLTDSVGGSTPPSRCCLDNGRYAPQLLSPDDSIPGSILEETSPDYLLWSTNISEEEQQEYMPMDRQSSANLTLPLSTSTRTNNNNNNNKYKPASPSQGSFLDMSSPVGSSPLDPAGRYMLMSPGADVTPQAAAPSSFPRSTGLYITAGGPGYASGSCSANHSRTSSLAEDTALGYVPMGPSQPSASHDYPPVDHQEQSSHHDDFTIHRDDGYVDMDNSRAESPGGSSCSLTSGTPSMTHTGEHAHHFSSEFHLEKVSSYFTPSEDDEDGGSGTSGSLPRQQDGPQPRPTRAYSLGSRPESIAARRNRLDVIQQEGTVPSRARACSMGAQQRPIIPRNTAQPRHHSPVTTVTRQRASTGPFLSSSWSGSSSAGVRMARRSQPTRQHPHASLEPIITDDNLMELDFSTGNKKNLSSDYLDTTDKVPTSPIFEEYVDMRKSNPIDLPPKKSTGMLPLWGSRSSNETDRVSPNRGSPNRGSTDDYLNMKGVRRGASQPINIASNQSATTSGGKSSTSPVLFSLSGLLSRKSSSGAGTPPKLPDRSNSPSPFNSLRRRGKKNSKKNKDKRSSISSDDASSVTTPVGVFPFSPSTPSKSFVPEEQFAKCSIDASGVRLSEERQDDEDVVDTPQPQLPPPMPHSYANCETAPQETDFISRLKADAELSNRRKLSTALRAPILGQSGGKTIVIGQDANILQAPSNNIRPRSSSSESEYVPMHPASSRRKFSDVAGYSESNSTLDKTRKCASDNILDASSSSHTSAMMSGSSSSSGGGGVVPRNIDVEDLKFVDDALQPDSELTVSPRDLSRLKNEDYAVMSIKADRPRRISTDYVPTSPRVTMANKLGETKKINENVGFMKQESNVVAGTSVKSSSKHSEDYALMTPGIVSMPPKPTHEPKSNNEEYAVMSFSKTPPKYPTTSSVKTSENAPTIPGNDVIETPAMTMPSMTHERVLETLTEHVATDCGDYALLAPRNVPVKPELPLRDYARIAAMPPRSLKSTEQQQKSLATSKPILPPPSESRQSNSNVMDDYALMIPGDGKSSPVLLDDQSEAVSLQEELPQPSTSSSMENTSKDYAGDYALMKPGENIIEYESNFKCVQKIDTSQDMGEYALLSTNKSSFVSKKCPPIQEQKSAEDYALMTAGRISEDKSVKDKKNSEMLHKTSESKIAVSKPIEVRRSPARDDTDEYVLMTPAIKPPMLPTRDAPLSLHLNNPSTAHSPLVVTTHGVIPQSSSVKSKPQEEQNKLVPDSTNVVPSGATIATTSSSSSSTIQQQQHQPQTTTTTVPIIPSLSVVTKSNPVISKPSLIPHHQKPTQSTPIHIPKSKQSSSTMSTTTTNPTIKNKTSTLPKSIPIKNSSTTTTVPLSSSSTLPRHIPAPTTNNNNKQNKTLVNKTTNNKPPTNNKQQQQQSTNKQTTTTKNTSVRRSASKSPLPTSTSNTLVAAAPPPELNYASLDLPQSQETSDEATPILARNLSSDSSGESDVTSVGTTYAQIDFVKTQQQQQQQQQNKKIQDRKT